MTGKPLNIFGLVVAVLLLAALPGCQKEPSRGEYQFANTTYQAVARKSEEGLDRVEAAIAKGLADGTVGEDEAETIRGIIATARGGDWDAAAEAAREIMDRNVRK